jgi:heme a synthase
VTIHLLGGMLLWSLLLWHYLATRADSLRVPMHLPAHLRTRIVWGFFTALALLIVQIALGGWTSTNYAAMACADWPLCQGKLWPEMDMRNGFDLSRDMGRVDGGAIIALDALAAIHFVHRNFAYVVAGVIALLAWRMHQSARFGRLPLALVGALLLQMVIGISTVVFNQPLLLAVAHNGGAAVLLGVMVLAGYKIRTSKPN